MAQRSDPIKSYGADPIGGFNFYVEVDGAGDIRGRFTEVSGLKGEVEEFEIKEGGLNSRTHKFPGRVSWGPITLKKGLGDEVFFNEWFDNVVNNTSGKVRKNIKILLLDREMNTVRTWDIAKAWPKSWEAPNLNAGSSELAIETLVLNHNGITESK
jgi:phage tail-like protein